MGLKYLWDTNIVIYYLQRQFPLKTEAETLIQNLAQGAQPAITVITEIELLCWRGASQQDIQILKQFIGSSILFNLNKPIKLTTIMLRQNYNIKLPDAIIAATALTYQLILLTRNVKDFKNITNLKIFNPFDFK